MTKLQALFNLDDTFDRAEVHDAVYDFVTCDLFRLRSILSRGHNSIGPKETDTLFEIVAAKLKPDQRSQIFGAMDLWEANEDPRLVCQIIDDVIEEVTNETIMALSQ